jgi:hypothetical protein
MDFKLWLLRISVRLRRDCATIKIGLGNLETLWSPVSSPRVAHQGELQFIMLVSDIEGDCLTSLGTGRYLSSVPAQVTSPQDWWKYVAVPHPKSEIFPGRAGVLRFNPRHPVRTLRGSRSPSHLPSFKYNHDQ